MIYGYLQAEQAKSQSQSYAPPYYYGSNTMRAQRHRGTSAVQTELVSSTDMRGQDHHAVATAISYLYNNNTRSPSILHPSTITTTCCNGGGGDDDVDTPLPRTMRTLHYSTTTMLLLMNSSIINIILLFILLFSTS